MSKFTPPDEPFPDDEMREVFIDRDLEEWARLNPQHRNASGKEWDLWLAAHDAEVRSAERERVATLVENERPEMGATINVSQYRTGKWDALTVALARIRALGEPDEQTTNHEIRRQER